MLTGSSIQHLAIESHILNIFPHFPGEESRHVFTGMNSCPDEAGGDPNERSFDKGHGGVIVE